jgi:hypothetical protein
VVIAIRQTEGGKNFVQGPKMSKPGRSGSTFIRLWLNSHPNVRCHSEIFFRGYPATDGFKSYCETNKVRRLLYYTLGRRRFTKSSYNFGIKWIIERFLRELYNNPSFSAPWTDMTTDAWIEYQPRGKSNLEKVVGFQSMYCQLADYRPLQEWIMNPDVSIIHLIRQNALKLLLSRIAAEKTGQYQFARNKSRQKVFLDPGEVLTQLNEIINAREKMRKKFLDNPYLEITYERFFSDNFEEAERIFAFLGIERAKVESPKFLKKLNPDSLEDLIENYDEIAMILKEMPYQEFLD